MLEIKENMIIMNYMIEKITIFFSPASADDEIEEQIVADIIKERPNKAPINNLEVITLRSYLIKI